MHHRLSLWSVPIWEFITSGFLLSHLLSVHPHCWPLQVLLCTDLPGPHLNVILFPLLVSVILWLLKIYRCLYFCAPDNILKYHLPTPWGRCSCSLNWCHIDCFRLICDSVALVLFSLGVRIFHQLCQCSALLWCDFALGGSLPWSAH